MISILGIIKQYNRIMKAKFKQYLFISLTIILISCGNDALVAPQQKNLLLPLAVSNYWIFETYHLDYSGRNIPNTQRFDTLIAEKQIDNKIWEFDLLSNSQHTKEYYYLNNNQIGYLFNPKTFGINIEKNIWIKIIDLELSSYKNFDTIIPNYEYVFKNDTMSAKINVAINTYKMRADTGIINNMRVKLFGYDTKIDRLIKFKYKFPEDPDSIEVTIAHLQNLKYDFAENIGFFNIRLDPSQIKISTYPKYLSYQGETIQLNGWNSKLIDWYLSK